MIAYHFEVGFIFQPDSYCIISQEREIQLSSTETAVLSLLCAANGCAVERNILISSVWPGDGREGGNSNLNKCILLLRRKFESIGFHDLIKTVPRVGYLINEQVQVESLASTTDIPFHGDEIHIRHISHNKILYLALSLVIFSCMVYYVTAYKKHNLDHTQLYIKQPYENVTIYNTKDIPTKSIPIEFIKSTTSAISALPATQQLLILNTDKSSSSILMSKEAKVVSFSNTVIFDKGTDVNYTCSSSQLLALANSKTHSIYRNLTSNAGIISLIQHNCDPSHWIKINVTKVESDSKVNNHFYYEMIGEDESGVDLFSITYYGLWQKRFTSLDNNLSFTINIQSQKLNILAPSQLYTNHLMSDVINRLNIEGTDITFKLLEQDGNILTYTSNILNGIPLVYYKDNL